MNLPRYSLLAVGVLFGALLSLFAWLCFKVDRQGTIDGARPADVIVILGAIVLPDGHAGEDLRVRTEHAVALYRRGLAPYIICTGGIVGEPLSAASVARSIAIDKGVPAQGILLAEGSMTTQEDAEQTARVMQARGWHSALLVSHPLHLYRARLLFAQQGLTVYTSPTNTNLAAIPPLWRLAYDAREALFSTWAGLQRWGVPKSWGDTVQGWWDVWSRRVELAR
jgi:uncharacterized SAM-binding protein YcdF (DUF218 family)